MQLYQQGMLRGADVSAVFAQLPPDKQQMIRQAQITAMASGINSPQRDQGNANVGMNIPFGVNAMVSPSMRAQYTNMPGSPPSTTFTPQVSLSNPAGRLNVGSNGYGGEVDLGRFMLNYQHQRYAGEPPANVYGINIPLTNDASIGGNVRQAPGRPNTYQANVNFPDVGGGSFGLTADMTPAERAYALYANYRKSF